MPPVQIVIHREPWDVDRRLVELGLDRQKLLSVVGVALSASADATPFHPANAAGTFAYQYGTWALRSQFVGPEWEIDRADSVEAIRNETTKVKVVYSNVDLACNDDQGPKPRSRKGAGSERVCNGNLFDDLPEYAPSQDEEYETFFLMVDENGAAELTRPVIKGGTFSTYLERNYLSNGGDGLDDDALFGNDDAANNFNPQVVRK